METISPPARVGDAQAERDARLAALAARRGPATAPTAGRQALEGRLAALAERRQPTLTARTGATPHRSKRRHPAKGARVAALGLSLASTGALAALFAMANGQVGNQVSAASIVATPVATPDVAAQAQAAAPTPTVVDLAVDLAADAAADPSTTSPATVATAAPAAVIAADTVVQGGVFHNKWGDVQVQATFAADGTLADVTALQTPFRDGKSVRINDSAVPQLISEALAIQSAQVDTVSGATYTSNDYRRSLQSAIDVANAAGVTAIA